jgi:antitoxin (DNA-binding transcriptional repressor) of toxin-antitoxin stability system
MKVKTGQLKAKLSSYLHRVREEGASYVVCDRDRPVALLCPLDQIPGNDWSRRRMTLLAQAREAGLQLSIPSRSPAKPRLAPQQAPLMAKGATVASMRKNRNW